MPEIGPLVGLMAGRFKSQRTPELSIREFLCYKREIPTAFTHGVPVRKSEGTGFRPKTELYLTERSDFLDRR
jgi:hypothetical protein